MNLSDRLALARVETGSAPETTQVPENPTLQDMSLDELDSRLPFKLPDISLEELEEKLGFKLPSLRIDQTEVEALGERLDTTADKEQAKQRGGMFASFIGRLTLSDELPQTADAEIESTHRTDRVRKVARLSLKTISIGLLLGVASSGFELQSKASTATKEKVTVETKLPTTETTVVPSTTITEASTTTTTQPEAPYIPYEAQVGDAVAEVVSPTICLVSYVEMISGEQSRFAGDGTGRSPIDAEIVLPVEQRQENCEQVLSFADMKRASTDPDYQLRSERNHVANKKNRPYPVVNGEQMEAGDYKAVAGMVEGIGVAPGQLGMFVEFAHGSTHAATFANLGAIEPGDKQYIVRSDGKVFEYTVIGQESIAYKGREAQAAQEIYNYAPGIDSATGKYNDAYMTQYACSDKDSNPGSDTHRIAVRSVMSGVLTIDQLKSVISEDLFSQLTNANFAHAA